MNTAPYCTILEECFIFGRDTAWKKACLVSKEDCSSLYMNMLFQKSGMLHVCVLNTVEGWINILKGSQTTRSLFSVSLLQSFTTTGCPAFVRIPYGRRTIGHLHLEVTLRSCDWFLRRSQDPWNCMSHWELGSPGRDMLPGSSLWCWFQTCNISVAVWFVWIWTSCHPHRNLPRFQWFRMHGGPGHQCWEAVRSHLAAGKPLGTWESSCRFYGIHEGCRACRACRACHCDHATDIKRGLGLSNRLTTQQTVSTESVMRLWSSRGERFPRFPKISHIWPTKGFEPPKTIQNWSFGVLWPSLIASYWASHGNKHETHPNPATTSSSGAKRFGVG